MLITENLESIGKAQKNSSPIKSNILPQLTFSIDLPMFLMPAYTFLLPKS